MGRLATQFKLEEFSGIEPDSEKALSGHKLAENRVWLLTLAYDTIIEFTG